MSMRKRRQTFFVTSIRPMSLSSIMTIPGHAVSVKRHQEESGSQVCNAAEVLHAALHSLSLSSSQSPPWSAGTTLRTFCWQQPLHVFSVFLMRRLQGLYGISVVSRIG